MNHFAIEVNGECYSPVLLADSDGKPAFSEFLDMSYDEMKNSEQLEDFVRAAMEAAERKSSDEEDYSDVIVTLIDEDDFFIWSVFMTSDGDEIQYKVVNWQEDDKRYKYMEDTP